MNTKTIKTLFPFLILLAFLAYNLEAGIENSFPNGAMVRDASNHADNALGNLGAYSKAEVDAIVATPTAEIAAHATSNNTHGCTVIASEAAIAAHAALSTTHNATTLASEAYVTGYAAKLAGDVAQDFSANNASVAGNISLEGYVKGSTINYNGSEMRFSGAQHSFSNYYEGNCAFFFDHRGVDNTGAWFWRNGTAGSKTCLALDSSGNASFSGDVRATSFTLGGNLKTGSNWISGDGDNEGIRVNAAGEALIATTTDAGDYKLQVNGNAYVNGTGYFVGALTAASYADNSDSPESLADAYEIINSHETKNGRLDHSKLSAKAWGKKSVQVGVNKVMKQIGTQTKETDEPVYETQPDQTSRNISMVISAQALAISDLLKRIEALEKK